ncbi:hypothetical protein OV207_12845 [Corallococcus sp. BB11-1]|uniref:hypothetical protein n=1 Tax=Corallococcus sp. BB11-1 TaxID=2996783 RepID=UPI00226E8F53|nr:hypothetical protein [Corallococcus sp. BB11-1]MCY1032351.1 hypothetical protein [Corallococcus sp. BB11-1]
MGQVLVSLGQAVQGARQDDGRQLLDLDVAAGDIHQPAGEEAVAHLEAQGREGVHRLGDEPVAGVGVQRRGAAARAVEQRVGEAVLVGVGEGDVQPLDGGKLLSLKH